ncbi:TAP-like protein-domain-containing protein [Whalleya microplaca]|nr:TAP-like protein-domain-containing protein [Whalleya microplaca]
MRRTTALALLGAGLAAAADPADFDWTTIKPSRDLEYHPCYGDEYQCARLLVPLDWGANGTSPSSKHTVALAIAKLPATVPVTDPSFAGTIFTNPGGPGGSGISLLLRKGHQLRDVASFDDDGSGGGGGGGGRHYEILSWDPRGVQFTTPRADCYAGDLAARQAGELQQSAIGALDGGPGVLGRQYARARGFGELCAQGAEEDAGSILPFLSTASVVRDMVEMVDKVDEQRAREASQLSPSPLSVSHVSNEQQQQQPLQRHGGVKEEARILYWGFSYGTLLGNTFASMYPGRVGRMIVDGIVDANDYTAGSWLSNLQDSEKIVSYFYTSCFEVGTPTCALKRSTDTKWEDMKARVDALVAKADAQPISVLRDDDKTTAIITGFEVLDVFRSALYSPLTGFRRVAETLSGALEGNYTLLLSTLSSPAAKLSESCTHPNNTVLATKIAGDASHAIMCGDGEDSTHLTPADWSAYVSELKSQSPTLGAFWAKIRFECAGWTIRPRWRYTGPFGTPHPPSASAFSSPDQKSHDDNNQLPRGGGWGEDSNEAEANQGRPEAPLLFLSSRLDPVTPLRNAYAMAASHAGAGLVVQESAGHCASAVPSACTRDIIRVYLASGTMPGPGTTCEADCGPWAPCEEVAVMARGDMGGDGDWEWDWGWI